MTYVRSLACAALLGASFSGCALLTRSDAMGVRYYTTEPVAGAAARARVRLRYVVSVERDVLREETLTTERPVDGVKDGAAVAAAMATALHEAVDVVADRVVNALADRRR